MNFHVVTLFPESFKSYLETSILARAQKEKKIKFNFYNPRDFVPISHKLRGTSKPYIRIDNKPYGGGPGMVMEAEPVVKAVEKALQNINKNNHSEIVTRNSLIVWLSPSGKQFDNEKAQKITKKYSDVIIICGRYEGIDERVFKVFKNYKNPSIQKLSIGPYVLTGGELPAMIIMDTISRRIPGVLGKIESVEENRVASPDVYTRPEVLEYKGKKYRVPKILLTGHHAKIEEWRNKKRK